MPESGIYGTYHRRFYDRFSIAVRYGAGADWNRDQPAAFGRDPISLVSAFVGTISQAEGSVGGGKAALSRVCYSLYYCIAESV